MSSKGASVTLKSQFDPWLLLVYALVVAALSPFLVPLAEMAAMARAIAREIDEAVAFAKASPFPTPDQLTAHLYAP